MICKKLGNYMGLEISKPDLVFDENLYKSKIDELLEANVQKRVKKTPINLGDEVSININGYNEEGEELTFMRADTHQVVLGRDNLFKEIEDALVGSKEGDTVTVHITFPAGHSALPGKTIRFEIYVISAFDRIFPELTDDFIAGLNIEDLDTVKDLEDYLREVVLDIQKQSIDGSLKNRLMKMVIELSEFEITDDEIKMEVAHMQAEFLQVIGMEGLTLNSYLEDAGLTHDEYMDDLYQKCKYRLMYHCIADEVAEKENIDADEDKVLGEMAILADNYGLPLEDYLLSNPDSHERVRKDNLRIKTVDYIFDRAIIRQDS